MRQLVMFGNKFTRKGKNAKKNLDYVVFMFEFMACIFLVVCLL